VERPQSGNTNERAYAAGWAAANRPLPWREAVRRLSGVSIGSDVREREGLGRKRMGRFPVPEEFRMPAGVPKSWRPEPAGHRRCYGVFGFRPASVTSDMADAGTNLDADRPDSGWRDGFTSGDSPALLDMVGHLMAIGAGDIGSASIGAAGYVAVVPCRVTTPASRIVMHALVVRGAGADVRRSRQRPCVHRSTGMTAGSRPVRPAYRPQPAAPPQVAGGRDRDGPCGLHRRAGRSDGCGGSPLGGCGAGSGG